uniref:NADH dehydrogenase [ubiquinone] 1 alpha subcomplex subunit 13 n=1 Tax=Clastoptera arizonana TaxID=38151 RepID=A0A1B6E8A5_9HEMI
MATAARKQDMPPSGGFRPLNFERVPPKTYFGGPTMILGFLGLSAGSLYLFYLHYKKVQRDRIELRSAVHAITPMLLAERDREYLKQLRRNRDEEAKLMQNVEGWEVGTFYGEPIYKTIPQDTFVGPMMKEYYIHAKDSEWAKRTDFCLWI